MSRTCPAHILTDPLSLSFVPSVSQAFLLQLPDLASDDNHQTPPKPDIQTNLYRKSHAFVQNSPFTAASAPFGFANAIIMKSKTNQNILRRLPTWLSLTIGVAIGILVSKLVFSSPVACLPALSPYPAS